VIQNYGNKKGTSGALIILLNQPVIQRGIVFADEKNLCPHSLITLLNA
jgi:hypothetical protein